MKLGPTHVSIPTRLIGAWDALIAACLGLASLLALWQFGGFTLWQAFMIGAMPTIAMLGITDKWRTERGIWILCALFGFFATAFLCEFVYFAIMDAQHGRGGAQGWVFAGAAISTCLGVIWISLTRGLANFVRFRDGRGPFGRPPGYSEVPAWPRSPRPSLSAQATPDDHPA